MVYEGIDSDVKIYAKYSEEDIKRYIDLYLRERKMGINFDALFSICKKDIQKKKWLIEELRLNPDIRNTLNIRDCIDDYTMHLLLMFFCLNSTNEMFTYIDKNFINDYVRNESELEKVDESDNAREVKAGLASMYKFLLSPENTATTGSMMITDLHEKLFSHVEDGRYARAYRTDVRFFPGTGIELEDPYLIPRCMRAADRTFAELYDEADKIFHSEVEDRINMVNPFLEKLMKYKVEVIRIHPFPDGNKRSTRGVVNFLLKRAGLLPVYIKICEQDKYYEALVAAMRDGNYDVLIDFYKNKLCDSIEELVVNPFTYAIDQYHREEEAKEEKRQKGSNVLRLMKYEDELKKQFGNKN